MSIKSVSLLKTSVSLVAITGLLILGGCKGGDKSGTSLSSSELSTLGLDKSNGNIFGSYFETGECASNEQEALGALAGLGIGETGDEGITYSKRETDGATVSYSDLKLDEGNGEIFTIKSAVFHCVGMVGEDPSFKRVDMKDLKLVEADTNISVGTLVIADQKGTMASKIFELDTMDFTDGTQFPAMTASDITGTVDGGEFSVKSVALGHKVTDDERNIGDFMIDDVAFNFEDPDTSQKMSFTFEGMTGRNFNMDDIFNAAAMEANGLGDLNLFENFAFDKKPYDEFTMGKANFDSDFMTLDFEGMDAKATEKGKVITIKQNMDPLTINLLPAAANEPELAQVYEQLKALDFDTMTLFGSSVSKINGNDGTFSVTDGKMVMKDAFTIDFEYEASGLDEMTEAMKNLTEDELLSNPLQMYESLSINSFKLSLEDQSIIERSIGLAAQMTGQSEDQLKSMVALGAAGAGLAATNDLEAKVYVDTATAFAEFVNKGGRLTIEIDPETPIAISDLLDGASMDPEKLGFSASQSD